MAKNSKFSNKTFDSPRILSMIQQLRLQYRDNERVTADMIQQMRTLRELFIEQEQPTIVKSIRLACEHIERFGKFDPRFLDEDSEESEYEYYLDLLTNPNNKYNRDEIKEFNLQLKESLENDDFFSLPRRSQLRMEEEEEYDDEEEDN